MIFVILNERIEAARSHVRLKKHFTSREVGGVDFQDPDMLSVNRCMEKIEVAVKHDKIGSGLRIFNQYGCFPRLAFKIIAGQKAVGVGMMLSDGVIVQLSDKIEAFVIQDIHGVFLFGIVYKVGLRYVFPCDKVGAFDNTGEISAVCAGIIVHLCRPTRLRWSTMIP